MIEKWDKRFLQVAELVASWSKDPSTKCGAVIVRPDKSIVSTGFNGFPKGCRDDDEIYENRELKYARVVHAEQNAIIQANENLHGYTMYTWPPGAGPSCDRCSAHIIQAGIKQVVYVCDEKAEMNSRWAEACRRGLDMYKEAQVSVVYYLKEEHEGLIR